LSEKLQLIYATPYNAEFGHSLFEGFSAIITLACKADSKNVDIFEETLLPIFFKILTEPDHGTYSPYAFQVMSCLIELRGTLHQNYYSLINELTKAQYWEDLGSRPALVRLIQAFIFYGSTVIKGEALINILGIFKKLLSHRQFDYLGFFLLESLVTSLEPDVYLEHIPTIFQIIFQRIQSSKTEQLVKSFIIFLSNFASKYGIEFVLTQVNRVQDGIFNMVLKSLWIPNVPKISGKIERKAVLCGTTLLLKLPVFLDSQEGLDVFRDLIKTLLLCFSGETGKTVDEGYVEVKEVVSNSGFSALKNATTTNSDYFRAIPDAKLFFTSTLQELMNSSVDNAAKIQKVLSSLDQEDKVRMQESLNIKL